MRAINVREWRPDDGGLSRDTAQILTTSPEVNFEVVAMAVNATDKFLALVGTQA